MSYHKKHYSPKLEHVEQQLLLPEVEFKNPGISLRLSTGQLTFGLPYQRPVESKNVDGLIEKWDDRMLTPIIVSFRDGNFNVVDGQHRIAAIRKMAGDRDVTVYCLLYTGMTYEQEAEMYYKLDRAKGRLRLAHATKALVESGTDAAITDIKRRVEEAGFIWALNRKVGKAYEITATRATINAYHLLDGAAFSWMLCLLTRTWHGVPDSLKASMLSGMALFFKTYETEIDDQTFIKRMSAVNPEEIIRRGRADFSTNCAALRFARVIRDKYNGHQRGGQKLPYRFKG